MKLTLAEARDALGVKEDATPEDERQAYRRLALRFHPDKNKDPGATAAFQRVSAAYKRVSDHRERQEKRRTSGGVPWASEFADVDSDEDLDGESFDEADLEDLEEMLFMFQMLFGGGPIRKKPNSKTGSGKNSTKKAASGPHSASNQPNAKPPSVSVNIGGRRRKLGKQHQRAHAHCQEEAALDREMQELFESAMFAGEGDPFGLGGVGEFDGLNAEDEEDFMAMASFFMGGHPGMADFTRFGDAFSEESNASDDGRMDNQNTPQFGENADTRDNQSYKPKDETKLAPLEVNADVRVYGRLSGTVRFIGEVHYAKGAFVGVELSGPVGKNDGTIKGVQYFSCAPSHGLMVRPADVTPAPSA